MGGVGGRQVEEGTEKREKEASKQEILHEVKSTGANPLCLNYAATSALCIMPAHRQLIPVISSLLLLL